MAQLFPRGGGGTLLRSRSGVTAMTGEEFLAQVEKRLSRATYDERQALRRELAGHMEDRTEALIQGGCGREEAVARAVEAMGDPAEIGAALNEQFSSFWLWMGRLGILLTALLCLRAFALWPYLMPYDAMERQEVQEDPAGAAVFDMILEDWGEPYPLWADVDVQMTVGDDILRVYRVSVDPEQGLAMVDACLYDREDGGKIGYIGECALLYTQTVNRQGEAFAPQNTINDPAVGYARWEGIPVAPGETLKLRYERFGRSAEMEISLPWEVEP